jgi:hypothetical protein
MASAVEVMLQEWQHNIKKLMEDTKFDDDDLGTITPGLKVKHKDSGIRYTVYSVSPRDVILKTPEGDKFLVSSETLESEYILA